MDKVKWRVNLPSIYKNAKNIFGYEKVGEYSNDLVVLIGEKSFQFELDIYRNIFPKIKQEHLRIIKNAGNSVI